MSDSLRILGVGERAHRFASTKILIIKVLIIKSEVSGFVVLHI